MTYPYFGNFPQVSYANNNALNLSKRVSLFAQAKAASTTFYPLEITDTQRADVLSFNVYNDATLDWLIYLTNNVIDPYYGWHLSQDDFDEYIILKYGSISNAKQYISYYRVVWPTGSPNPGGFDSLDLSAFQALPDILKKYWQPVFGYNGLVSSYKLPKENWKMNTNQILEWNLSMDISNTVFQSNDLLQVLSGGNIIGQVQCIGGNSSVVNVMNTSGFTDAPRAVRSYANNSVTGTILTSTTLVQNISFDEASYWESVSFYDVEDEKNTMKRFVDLVDKSVVLPITQAIKKDLAS